MSLVVARGRCSRAISTKESEMPATYTFDVVSTLDGFASFEGGDWGPFWSKRGPDCSTIASPPTASSSG